MSKDGSHFEVRDLNLGLFRNCLGNGCFSFSVCRSVEAAADRQYSYVILTTKAIPERTKTSHILAPFLSSKYNEHFPQPVYVLIQNGLNVEVELYFALKALFRQDPRIISTAALIGTNLRAPNVVEHNNSVSTKFVMF
jgi:2-dehydropantoate 2-reductase